MSYDQELAVSLESTGVAADNAATPRCPYLLRISVTRNRSMRFRYCVVLSQFPLVVIEIPIDHLLHRNQIWRIRLRSCLRVEAMFGHHVIESLCAFAGQWSITCRTFVIRHYYFVSHIFLSNRQHGTTCHQE